MTDDAYIAELIRAEMALCHVGPNKSGDRITGFFNEIDQHINAINAGQIHARAIQKTLRAIEVFLAK